jgi:hypothetical protein
MNAQRLTTKSDRLSVRYNLFPSLSFVVTSASIGIVVRQVKVKEAREDSHLQACISPASANIHSTKTE